MTTQQYLRNLEVPDGVIDVVLDTDTYNEIDDQFALAYLLKSRDKLSLREIYAAPFLNSNSVSAEDGMLKSYDEILKVLDLADCDEYKDLVFKGSRQFMTGETEPVISPAAERLAETAMAYSPEKPLYVVAIGAITNVASALLLRPEIKERIVVVWLGGHSLEFGITNEFNMRQDVAAARIVFGCGVPLVQLPCMGVVSAFATTGPELTHWLAGKTKLSDYLAKNTIAEAESYAKGKPWSRTIWDVTAVAWLLNDGDRFMSSRLIHSPVPTYDNLYAHDESRHLIRYVYRIKRDQLFEDLFDKLTK